MSLENRELENLLALEAQFDEARMNNDVPVMEAILNNVYNNYSEQDAIALASLLTRDTQAKIGWIDATDLEEKFA